MNVEKYQDQRDILGTRTRAFQATDTDGTYYFAGRMDYAHTIPPVEWVHNGTTNRKLRPGSKRFVRVMEACMASEEAEEAEEEGTTLRRRFDVTARIEQLADI